MLKTKLSAFIEGLKYYLLTLLFAFPKRRFIKRLLLRLSKGKPVENDFGRIFYVFNRNVGWIYVDGSYYLYLWHHEKNVMKLIKRCLCGGLKGLFIDVGAHIGFYSILLAKGGGLS